MRFFINLSYFIQAAKKIALPGVVFLAVFILSLMFYYRFADIMISSSAKHLDSDINEVMYDLGVTGDHLETSLEAARAFIESSHSVKRSDFYKYIDTSDFFKHNNSVSSLAFIKKVNHKDLESFVKEVQNDRTFNTKGYPNFRVNPESKYDEHWPIVYVYPENNLSQMLGFDMYYDPVRRATVADARDSAQPKITPLVKLASDNQLGFIFVVAYYDSDISPTSTVADRQKYFAGAINMSLRAGDYFPKLLENRLKDKDLTLNIYDSKIGEPVTEDRLIYSYGYFVKEKSFLSAAIYPVVSKRVDFSIGGRVWQIYYKAKSGYGLTSTEKYLPYIMLSVGVLISVLLALVVYVAMNRNESRVMIRENKLLKDQTEFIATISHQLRTPLAALQIGVQTFAAQIRDKDIANGLLDKFHNIIEIVNNLLFYLKLLKSNEVVKDEMVSVSDVVAEVIGDSRESLDAKGVKIDFKSYLDTDRVLMQKDLFRKVIFYLVDNAIDYSKPGSTVVIGIYGKNNGVEIVIKDQGYGIPEKEQAKVFEKFFRASNADLGKNEGSGVGLYLSKLIIGAHDGNITFKSKENEGTEFSVYIPYK